MSRIIEDKKQFIKQLVVAIVSSLLFLTTVILTFDFFGKIIKIFLIIATLTIIALYMIGILAKKNAPYKASIIFTYLGIVILSASALVIRSGVLSNIDSVNDLVNLVNSFGIGGKLVFILIQFLQVTFIPIPSTIVTGAGALLYNPWESLLLSCIGLWGGSLFAFYLGRAFGYKLVKWVIGEDILVKYNNFVKGKDKIMFVYMFILPIFPDDMLCMLAGLTNMSYPGFILIQLISRPINVAGTVFMMDYMSLIPFKGWGILIWALIALLFIVLFVLMWKFSDKIEKGLLKLISKITGRPLIKNIYTVYSEKTQSANASQSFNKNKIDKLTPSKDIPLESDSKNEATNKSEISLFEESNRVIDNIISKTDEPFIY